MNWLFITFLMLQNQETPICYVTIKWFTPDEGGRKVLPKIGYYRPHICFDNDAEKYKWAIGCSIEKQPEYCINTICKIDFLFDIPSLLFTKPGIEFSIIEGNKVVGRGIVIHMQDDKDVNIH